MEEGNAVGRGRPDGDIRALESLAFGPIRIAHLATRYNNPALSPYTIQFWSYDGPFAGWAPLRLCECDRE